ncbi:myopalladin [Pimephales promelas]|uniref:myopalladin n=1 Tax=Pimephales promelas TaxID=90988 RepID=UPI001955D2BB|nr:myopalladin [Pimephales promelas]
MEENNMDQPTSLSQHLRESYLSEARAHHRHGEPSLIDAPRLLLYGTVKEKPEDLGGKVDAQFPDLSAFLSQEELDKSVDLACKAISNDPREREERCPQMSHFSSKPTQVVSESSQPIQPLIEENTIRSVRTSREAAADFKRPQRNAPYGLETQSKKEFLNKAADFIEELSSLFKSNSSKRVRPRTCKAHRSRYQNKTQLDGTSYSINADDRERTIRMEEPMENNQVLDTEEPEEPEEPEPSREIECEAPALIQAEEPVCEPPHFIQKLKSREVPEGSKVQLDCIVRGLPAPEVRWFCEGKELENSPDIQIITNGERHSLIIAEAFEEDTGRYSCFASNFYGTDSTSAEIYIEGASSSDSDGEQHFEEQSPQPKPAEISVEFNTSAEDTTVTTTCTEPPAPSDANSPSEQEDTELLRTKVVSTEITLLEPTIPVLEPTIPVLERAVPVLEPTVPVLEQAIPVPEPTVPVLEPLEPISEVEPTPLSPTLTITPSSLQSSQSISDILLTSQQSIPENLNGSSSYLQNFDVRPIMAAPVFTKNLQDVLALESQLVVLECRVKGIPSPKVDWYREGTLIEDSPDFRILQKKPRSMAESEEICTLVIAEVFPEDSGTFTCTASNKYGTVSSIAVLRVKGHNNNNTTKPTTTSTLTVESSPPKFQATDLKSTTLKRKPDVPLVNNKIHSSMICLDPLSTGFKQSGPLDSETFRSDSLNPSMFRHELSTSLPSLNPLSIGKHSSDTFKSSLPRLDPPSFNASSLTSDSNHKSVNSSTTHFDSGGSGCKPSTEVNQSPSNGLASLNLDHQNGSNSTSCLSVTSPKTVNISNHQEQPPVKPLPDPPTSCLKTRPEGVLANHNEPRSTSRAGLRVTFKLPEDEEEEEEKEISSKEPPPVLAKPKLDPVQLQILHNQVLLEQLQDNVSPSQELPHLDGTNCEPPPVTPTQPPVPPLVIPSGPIPQLIPASIPAPILKAVPVSHLTNSIPLPQLTPSATTLHTLQQNLVPTTLLNTVPPSMVPSTLIPPNNSVPISTNVPSVIPITQPIGPPNIPMPQSNVGHSMPFLQIMAPSIQPNPNYVTNKPPITPSSHISQMNMNPTFQMNSVPNSDALMTPNAAVVNKLNTTSITHPSMAPQDTRSQNVSYPPVSIVPTPHMVRNPPAPIPSQPNNTSQPPLPGIFPISAQSFSYTRPKEFIAAQTLSPTRSLSPTESPVPMLHELAAQIFPKSTREITSPVNQFAPSPRKFPTRVLESPRSPPYVSSPPLLPPGLVNSVFSFRTQSPTQASSPSTSSSSSPSPIQNPVAFLSSVLPSLPTSPPTNAMGLPKRAPLGPQSSLKKNQRVSRLMSDSELRESKETLLQDIEKTLRFKDEPHHFGQQKPSYVGEVSRSLGPNIPTAAVVNYDEEYKVSSFEQRLMSEIGFRLERTPVEESDDEVQHDEIPTGRCIAPIFDKKLKHLRAVEGIPVTFTCKVVGIPIPKVYWFKDGKQILKKNEHYRKIREGDGTCSLHIEAATSDDDGNYTVMAANPQGRISCSGHLIVQTGPVRNRPMVHAQRVRARVQEVEGEPAQERFFRPHFLQAPGDMLAHEGRLCRLDCKVSGLPHPEIMWLLNGKPIYPDITHRMLVRENGIHSLVVDPLTQADDGTYTCIASNKAGQSSFCLQLRVVEKELKQAPYFVEKLQNTGVAEGAPVRLECRVVGMPQPLIYWKKDNDTIPHSKDRVSMHQDTTGYVCLLIQPTRKEDAGWYTVSAKNEAGIVSCTARLDIYAQWHQPVHPPLKRTQISSSRYAALTAHGLDVKSAFPTSDGGPRAAPTQESDEL